MRLSYIDICGFRGFRNAIRISLSDNFTIIDGRNGVGKSTIFDAVEFALTGTISKYLDAKASGETVDDYIWWTGEDNAPEKRYVEVGFRNGVEECSVRRTPFDALDVNMAKVLEKLVDEEFAPKAAITQLCAATIIRDEHIARLSLDLKEGDRFTLLRDAIGAIDAEEWINKASRLSSIAGKKHKEASGELEEAKKKSESVERHLDRVRAELSNTSGIGVSIERLRGLLASTASADELVGVARTRISNIQAEVEHVEEILKEWREAEECLGKIDSLERKVESAKELWKEAQQNWERLKESHGTVLEADRLSSQARQLEALAHLGHSVGTRDGHCPLCNSEIGEVAFEGSIATVLDLAKQLDERAVEQAERQREVARLAEEVASAKAALDEAIEARDQASAIVSKFHKTTNEVEFKVNSIEDVERHLQVLEMRQKEIATELRLLDTLALNEVLGRAVAARNDAEEGVRRAEVRLGRTRLAEMRAKAIHDAVRRAAAETLDQRLGRVLPLMSELYRRLRPHPIWDDIEYSVRGDVRRFLKLQVGGEVNPQFVFSSGQRRATGLAFLLSMNMSISWNRWRSILLDDPVQHVDDFRTIHLAEVLAHLCHSGQQIVCAVEDSALADLMCRRLSSSREVDGKRVTLGTNDDGSLGISQEKALAPLRHRALVHEDQAMGA